MNISGPQIALMEKPEVRAVREQTRVLHSMMNGQATWDAMKNAVERLRRSAPDGHDVVVMVGDVAVHEAFFIEPHTFLFEGVNLDGHSTWIVLHFSQLAVGVIHRPKRKPEPVITGFNPHAPAA